MSIKLMSAIFETEFRDLPYTKDGEERKAKASTCKLVLLAIADHANDYGESAYPGYDKLEIKTSLSRQGISDTLDALVQNGIIEISENRSRLHTNSYSIQLSAFPSMKNEIIEESSHLTLPSQATGLERVKPLDLNHPLTTIKPSKTDDTKGEYDVVKEANKTMDAILGMSKETQPIRDAEILFESIFGFGTLPWDSKKEWQKFGKWIAEIVKNDSGALKDYVTWRAGDGKYQAMSNNKIRQNPQMFMDTGWPTFLAHSSMYGSSSPAERNPIGI